MAVDKNVMAKKGIDQESKKLFLETLNKITGDEFADLFESLLSSSEFKDISRRLMAAKLLHQKVTYEEAQEIMGMGSNTVNKTYFKTKANPTLRQLFRKD